MMAMHYKAIENVTARWYIKASALVPHNLSSTLCYFKALQINRGTAAAANPATILEQDILY